MTDGPSPALRSMHRDYSQWSIEELWQFAVQLRVAGARGKSRRELIDLFAAPSPQKLRDKELS
jgi:hypothetical protein